ncbi:MAG: hypothetical protein CL613_06450 [Aquimarina sp.]|nr:hypothetical protein [Aquimarina sp.]
MEVFRNAMYSVTYISEIETIQFNWLEGHVDMTYDDFKEACNNFLGYGFEYKAKNILIGVRNFQFQLPSDFPEWQKEKHYPRYYKLGIEKVAYVMPEAFISEAKEIPKEEGKFELRNFTTIETATNFFN